MTGTPIREVVQAVVNEYAPAETVIVDGLADLDDDQVVRLMRRRRDRDDLQDAVFKGQATAPAHW
jgi:hypothetical protein